MAAGLIHSQSLVSLGGSDADAEPEYNAGTDILLVHDDMSIYTLGMTDSQIASTSPFWTFADNAEIIAGNPITGGAGKSCELTLAAGAGASAVLQAEDFTDRVKLNITYYFKLTPGIFFGGSGIKWFIIDRDAVNARWTNGMGDLTGGPSGHENTGMDVSVHDNYWAFHTPPTDVNPWCENLTKIPNFESCADGQWHRITYAFVDASGKGVEVWLDGTKVLSTYDGQPGVASGGFQSPGLGYLAVYFDGLVVTAATPNTGFTIGLSDFTIWAPP